MSDRSNTPPQQLDIFDAVVAQRNVVEFGPDRPPHLFLVSRASKRDAPVVRSEPSEQAILDAVLRRAAKLGW